MKGLSVCLSEDSPHHKSSAPSPQFPLTTRDKITTNQVLPEPPQQSAESHLKILFSFITSLLETLHPLTATTDAPKHTRADTHTRLRTLLFKSPRTEQPRPPSAEPDQVLLQLHLPSGTHVNPHARLKLQSPPPHSSGAPGLTSGAAEGGVPGQREQPAESEQQSRQEGHISEPHLRKTRIMSAPRGGERDREVGQVPRKKETARQTDRYRRQRDGGGASRRGGRSYWEPGGREGGERGETKEGERGRERETEKVNNGSNICKHQ